MAKGVGKHEPPAELLPLIGCLKRVPCVIAERPFAGGFYQDGRWWLVFRLSTDGSLAWDVVQRLANILNDVSTTDPPATVLMPLAPDPIWGGFENEMWWCLEAARGGVDPAAIARELEARLPQPIENEDLWPLRAQ